MHDFDFDALDESASLRLMAAARRLTPAVRAATRPVQVGLVIAGFDAPRTHVHLIPMHDDHDVTSRLRRWSPARHTGRRPGREAVRLRAHA